MLFLYREKYTKIQKSTWEPDIGTKKIRMILKYQKTNRLCLNEKGIFCNECTFLINLFDK